MSLRLFARVLAGVAKVLGIASLTAFATTGILNQPSYAESRSFYCDQIDGVPVTFARTQDGRKMPVIYWATKNSFPPPWTPVRRCQDVSRRFQMNFDNGTLKFINTGRLLKQSVVCGAIRKDDPCTYKTLLFTLKGNSDPKSVLTNLLDRRELGIRNSSVVTSTTIDSSIESLSSATRNGKVVTSTDIQIQVEDQQTSVGTGSLQSQVNVPTNNDTGGSTQVKINPSNQTVQSTNPSPFRPSADRK